MQRPARKIQHTDQVRIKQSARSTEPWQGQGLSPRISPSNLRNDKLARCRYHTKENLIQFRKWSNTLVSLRFKELHHPTIDSWPIDVKSDTTRPSNVFSTDGHPIKITLLPRNQVLDVFESWTISCHAIPAGADDFCQVGG